MLARPNLQNPVLPLVAAMAICCSLPGFALPDEPVLDAEDPMANPPGKIEFKGSNKLHSARGVFHRWRVSEARVDMEKPSESVVVIEIELASLDSGDEDRDENLRGKDFFHVEKYPLATIRFDAVRDHPDPPEKGEWYTADMAMTLRGVCRKSTIEFELLGEKPLELRGETVIHRLDFGVGDPPKWYNPLAIRKEVPIRYHLVLDAPPLAKTPAPAPSP